jgi:hypothetical protein
MALTDEQRQRRLKRVADASTAESLAIKNGAPPQELQRLKREIYIAMGPDIPAVIAQTVTDKAAIYHGDAVQVLTGLPDESIHYSIFSPPFASLYTYSNSERDLGNCRTYEEFFEHYQFIAKELYRVTKPGRLLSFHCMLLPATKEHDGFMGIRDFRGDLIRAHIGEDAFGMYKAIAGFRARADMAEADGYKRRAEILRDSANAMEEDLKEFPPAGAFIFHSEVVIWKDPLIAATRTHAHGLAHKELVKDSAVSRQGIPDYLVTMRKPGENKERISHKPSGLDRWIGEAPAPNGAYDPNPAKNKQSHLIWQRYASPVWMDIDASDTLQRESVREDKDERHICPLQLQVIERGIELWSNPGDVVLSPFAGIGSEGYVAVRSGRRAVLVELKESHYKQACANITAAENLFQQLPMFPTETDSALPHLDSADSVTQTIEKVPETS